MNRALILFCVIVLSASFGAYAKGAAHQTTHIVTNQAKGIFTIIIDGKPALQVDKDGLLVSGDIVSGGSFTEAGGTYVRKAMARKLKGGRKPCAVIRP